ncbi:MAG: hypothetical protein ACLFUR_04800 [Candidatus Hadarchaeia archaeon]
MKSDEREIIENVFASVTPYLTYTDKTRDVIDQISEESSNIEEFKERLNSKISEADNPTTEADYRIFFNKLTSR